MNFIHIVKLHMYQSQWFLSKSPQDIQANLHTSNYGFSPSASAQARSTSVSSSAVKLRRKGLWKATRMQTCQTCCKMVSIVSTTSGACNNPLTGIYEKGFPKRLRAIASMLAPRKRWFHVTVFTRHPKLAGAMKMWESDCLNHNEWWLHMVAYVYP